MCTVIRNIYPIGQGGFASEYHVDNDKTIVYDCGSVSYNIQPIFYDLIKNYLPSNTIDILFISHFDDDHINQISTLKNHKSIKNVVIPLVKNIKLIEFLSKGEETKLFIRNPEEYFENKARIIRVREIEDGDNEIKRPINLDEEQSLSISSLQPIILNNGWEYIPFNVREDDRIKLFRMECKKNNLNYNELNNLNYLLHNEKNIRNTYKNVKGGINANSMLLYSGATISSKINIFINHDNCIGNLKCHHNWKQICQHCCEYRLYQNKEACLYTGDWDCSWINELMSTFSTRKDRIGLIQIPHHGSRYNFKKQLILNKDLHWFVQYGFNNKYRHPAKGVYSDILQAPGLHCIHSITEFNHCPLQQWIAYQ